MVLRLRGGKPVILLYDNEKKVNEEVEIQLELNEAMGIGATYPSPRERDEKDEKKKKYVWKGTYSSNGNESCSISIGNKKYDYIFWEGPCLKEEAFQGESIGIQ